MTAYYKATRLDATSFYDSKTSWRVGHITRLEGTLGQELCGPDVLHASTELGEVLSGGEWPCRLFEVEPRGELLTSPDHPYKVGCAAWKVVAELEAWRALGPNGQRVAAFITQVWAAAWDAARAAAWDAAWAGASCAAWAAASYAAWGAARDAASYAASYAARAAARDAARAAAGYVAWDAAMALAVEDLITTEQFATLTGPWVSVMGELS